MVARKAVGAGSAPDREARALLTDKGLRVTAQRLAILRELRMLRVPVSHAELTERLAGPGLDRATIYRNLIALTDAGALVRTQLGDGVWRFELPGGRGTEHRTHPHFVCTECGDVACLNADAVKLQTEALRDRVAEVQLRGRCTGCAHEA